jgi:hypothetical protein
LTIQTEYQQEYHRHYPNSVFQIQEQHFYDLFHPVQQHRTQEIQLPSHNLQITD